MTVCLQAHEIVSGREEDYGEIAPSWGRVADVVALVSGPRTSPAERAVLTLIAAKLVRRIHSPGNRDHYVDMAGYAEVLWRVAEAAEREAQELLEQGHAAPPGEPVSVYPLCADCARQRVGSRGERCETCATVAWARSEVVPPPPA